MSARRARLRDLRLIPAVLGCWTAAAAALLVPRIGGAIAGSLVVAACALLIVAARTGGRWRGFACAAAVAAACGAAAGAHVALAEPARAAAAALPFGGGREISAEGTVVGKVERYGAGWRFDVVAHELVAGRSILRFDVPVVVLSERHPQDVDLGARIAVAGSASLADPGERAVLLIALRDGPVLRAPPPGPLAVAAGLREGLHRSVDGLPSPGAGLVPGLAVGDTSAVDPELDAAMKTASLSHLTAVSGANCALVVGAAYALAGVAGARRGTRVIVAAAALTGFVVLVTPEPSVVRAAAMAGVAMVAVLIGRTGPGASVLSLAAVVALIADPWLALSLGFALSAAATGALLLLAGPIADGLARWIPAPLALALAVPLSTQLVCGPLLILIAPAVPVYGVAANLLAAPAAPAATVLGLLACLTGGIPVLAQGLAALAWVPAAWIAETARTVAALPGATVAWLEGPAGLLAATACGAAVVVLLSAAAHEWLRRASIVLLAVAVGAGLALGPVGDMLDRLRVPRTWTLAVCDVGQGDAVLVRSSGRVALIDAGPDPAALSACLDRFGISRIDLFVLTHFDLDHRGGAAALDGRVEVALHGPVDDPDARATIRALEEGGARAVQAEAGMTGLLGSASWRVRWPRAAANAYAGNDASVVVEFAGGGVPATILLGDLSAEPQTILAGTIDGRYDVVKVAHHGSADQSAALYEAVGAPVALIPVGENRYGHPRDEVLDILAAGGAAVFRTDLHGPIALWRDGGVIRVWTDRDVGGRR